MESRLLVILLSLLMTVQFTVGQNNVGLLLQTTSSSLPNITLISSSQFPGGVNQGLTCHSNYSIATAPQNIGQWFDPAGSEIMTDFHSIYRLPGPGTVTLYRSVSLVGREGIYTCTIPDTTGRVYTIYAGIYTDDSVRNARPVFTSPPSFTRLTPLSSYPPSFTITCTTSSFPPTYVNWTRDGTLVENTGQSYQTNQILLNARTTTFNSTLTVRGQFSPGQYNCTVSNSEDQSTGTYTVRAPSSPPTNISSEFLGAGNVRITWTPPTGDIDGYQVFYDQVNGSDRGVIMTGPGSNVVLRSLRAAATYSIQIMAYADLPTRPSNPIHVTLNVAGSPENITVTSLNDNATVLLVDWDEPITGSSNVVGYIVEYEPLANASYNCPSGISGGQLQTTNTSLLLTSLQESTIYSIRVRTISTAAVGEPSPPLNGTTSISSPAGPPLNVTVTPINPDRINITWEPPLCLLQNGPITEYTIHRIDLTLNFPDSPITVRQGLNYSITGLAAFRNFSFTVSAVNRNGSFTSNRIYSHLIAVPNSVEGLAPRLQDLTSIELEWDAPRLDRLMLPDFFTRNFNYSIEWYRTPPQGQPRGQRLGEGLVQGSRNYRVVHLLPNTSYHFDVYAISSEGRGTMRSSIDRQTRSISQIVRVRVNEINSTSLSVTWSPLSSPDVLYYRIYYNSSFQQEGVVVNVTGYQSSSLTLVDLDNSAVYVFSVAAVVNTREEGFVEGPRSNTTSFSFTQHSNLSLILIISGGTIGGLLLLIVMITITVVILVILNRSIGPQLAVKGEEGYMLVPLKSREHDLLTTPNTGRPTILETPPTEVHAVEGQEVVLRVHFHGNPTPTLSWQRDGEEIDWENSTFVLRDGIILFPYVEVDHSGQYQVTASNDNGSEIVTIKLTVYPETELIQIPPKEEEMILSAKIPLEEFGQYVASFHCNNNRKFREQFKRLSVPNLPIEVAWNEENHVFNRNQSVVVYDSNRIKLEPLARFLDCHHTYINASEIIGEDGNDSKKFIATQGPLDRTVVDFWRMVWQEKVCAIVMLTNLQEDLRIKCSQYWPSKGSEEHGPFTVTLIKETVHPSYTVREMTLHYNTMIGNLRSKLVNPTGKVDTNKKEYFSASQSTLILTQYHYTDWPEHGSPKSISSLLTLHRLMLTGTNQKKGPVVVHCSTGSGRTGAFIALDMILKQVQETSIIDVPAVVDTLRQQRMMMIQTLDQYITVHDAVLEQVLCGNTQISASQLRDTIQSLTSKGEDGKSGFDSQFQVLDQISVALEDASCDVAKHNMRKNRNKDILPTDQWRVLLKGESNDYVNASFIPSYKNDHGFIIAQSPLRETRRDFWKMIFDREITTIVMLSPVVEGGEEVCSQYWPNEGNVEFNEFTVSVKDQWAHDGFSRKLLLIRDTKSNLLRRLAQFQVNGWSNDGVTSCNITSIVNTINLVNTVQRKNPHVPILVHCSNMIGRSAMFCATMATIEQMKEEGVADVFQVVKAMRTHLPGAVETKVQYEMIHSIAASFIDLFSTSANY